MAGLLYLLKLDRAAPLVADPPPAYSTTYTFVQTLCYGDHMLNLIVGPMSNRRGFITRQNQDTCSAPLAITDTFE